MSGHTKNDPQPFQFQKEEEEETSAAAKEEEEEEEEKSTAEEKNKNIEELEIESPISAQNDDGFTTPTSSDHKIPEINECPPAPKRELKRKASPTTAAQRSLQFVEPADVDSIFWPINVPNQDKVEEIKVKKARKDDDQESPKR